MASALTVPPPRPPTPPALPLSPPAPTLLALSYFTSLLPPPHLPGVILAAATAWEALIRERGPRALTPPAPPREQAALACFCTHAVGCGACARAIEGSRWECVGCGRGVSLCRACRGKGCGAPAGCTWVVYEHPWEAGLEYRRVGGDGLRVPEGVLKEGDVGGRVCHLQYVLYKMGYVNGGEFEGGTFCGGTRGGVEKVQGDLGVAVDGVFGVATRSVVLRVLKEVEARYRGGGCRIEAMGQQAGGIRTGALAA